VNGEADLEKWDKPNLVQSEIADGLSTGDPGFASLQALPQNVTYAVYVKLPPDVAFHRVWKYLAIEQALDYGQQAQGIVVEQELTWDSWLLPNTLKRQKASKVYYGCVPWNEPKT
jgi:hypothetical protein